MIKFEDYKQYLSPVFYKQTNLVAKVPPGAISPMLRATATSTLYRELPSMHWGTTTRPS